MATTTVPQIAAPAAGRGYLWGGLGLAVLAIVLCVVQFVVLRRLVAPWHLPALTTLGAVLLFVALAQRRSVTRIVVFALVAALAAFEWHFLMNLTALPGYTGPAQTGQPMPAFQTKLADGSAFSDSDLRDGVPTVMVFFRGRW
jgi:hypothetical protein